jgi:hypothetical protein
MQLTSAEIAELKKIIAIAQSLLAKANKSNVGNGRSGRKNGSVRTRRSGKELAAFRKMLKVERKAGTPVAQLAKKHGVSASYIYQIG